MDRFRERRERLRPSVNAGEVDGFAISSPTNVRYLTGFTGDSSILLVGHERDVIVSDGRFATQLVQECPDLEARIRPTGVEMAVELGRVTEALGWRRLAFETASCTFAEYEAFREAMPTVELNGVKGWVESLRRVKDEFEIEEIRGAVRCAEKSFTMVRAGLRDVDSEKDIADAIETAMRRCGATASSFPRSWPSASVRPCPMRDRRAPRCCATRTLCSSTGARPASRTKVT